MLTKDQAEVESRVTELLRLEEGVCEDEGDSEGSGVARVRVD